MPGRRAARYDPITGALRHRLHPPHENEMVTTAPDRIAAALQLLESPTPPPAPQQPVDRAAAAEAALLDARLAFADLLRRWQVCNGWSQDSPALIARAAGFDGFDVHNSQWCTLCKGGLQPKPKTFATLAVLNSLVADQAWAAAPGINPRARQALERATPLCLADGTPWSAADFFAVFVGC